MAVIAANLQSFTAKTGSSASIARNPIRTIAWLSTNISEIFAAAAVGFFMTAP